MDFCQAEGVKVLVLQGNHDKVQQAGVDKPIAPWATASHDWPIYVGDGRVFKLGDHCCTALDYASMDTIEGQIRKVDTPVLFLHQAVKQALGFENAWNCDLDWVPPCVKLTVLGDIHKPMDLPMPSGQKACYTGVGHARDIDQTGPKSVIVIYDDLTYSREPIPSRSIKKFYVKSVKDIDEVNAWVALAKTVQKLPPLLWMVHTAEMASYVSTVRSQVISNGLMIVHTESLIDDDEVETSTVVDDEDDISPTKLLSKIVDPEKDKELFSFIAELVDDRRALADIVTERKTL
jgi:DNA repair exonuclease SbcCD nuclease subunit